jgi:hypothetical protein
LISLQIQVPASAQPGTHYITLVERGTGTAAQTTLAVMTDWPMQGFNFFGRGYNPYENTINTSNVHDLSTSWTKVVSNLGNATPFVDLAGNLFVGDTTGAIHAFSSAGALLWTASPGNDLQSVTPAGYGAYVYFGGSDGNVRAYKAACRKDGGVCTPTWTRSVGTSVTGSLVVYNGRVYAPSADGSIHPLNPLTGAPGTPIFGIDTSHGAVTTPVTFDADGAFVYGAGSTLEFHFNCCTGTVTYGGTVSPIAVANGAWYFTTSDGIIHQFGGSGWSATTSSGGCAPAPAISKNIVYAGGCTTLGAFDAGSGALRWSVTTTGAVSSVSVANGVLYACIYTSGGFSAVVHAYDATYGTHLWTGSYCTGGPVVASGMVYAAGNGEFFAYNLQSANPNVVMAKPDPKKLTPDYRLQAQAYRPLSENVAD